MRLSVLTFILTLFVATAFAQWGDNNIELSHNITTETKNITGFEKIEVSEDFQVYIRISDSAEKVEIEANENLHALINVEKDGNTLKIDTKSYSTNGGWGNKNSAQERLVAYITVKRLTEISADEDVVIVLEDKLTADKLTINLDEDCTFEGDLSVNNLIVDLKEDSVLEGHLEVLNMTAELDEDSVIDVKGTVQDMEVEANEDSMIMGYDFIVGNLKIELNEDSESKLTVNGNIDLRANGDSYFYYRGDGNFVRKRLRGDSEVNP